MEALNLLMMTKLAILLLAMTALSACSVQDLKRVGPFDKRPEWQKTSPFTQEATSKRQDWIIKQTERD